MAIARATPRDKLEQLIAFVLRSRRYWWLIGVAFVIGAALGTLLAIKTQRKYLSSAVLIYQERIQSSLLQGRDVMTRTKNMAMRYREMLMARKQLAQVVEKFDLFPKVAAKQGMDAAVDEFKLQLGFKVRGTDMFEISYESPDPDQAQAITEMLTTMLIDEDLRIRRETAFATRNFLVKKKEEADQQLRKRERELSRFLAEHPEFAAMTIPGQTAGGAGIRAAAEGRNAVPVNDKGEVDGKLIALGRQRQRIKDSLRAAENPSAPTRRQRTAEEIEAEQAVRDAERELGSAERNVTNKRNEGLTDRHPDVKTAKQRVDAAQGTLARAQVALDRAQASAPKPIVTKIDRDVLEQQLADLDKQITRRRTDLKRTKDGEAAADDAAKDDAAAEEENWVVALETEYAGLSRLVSESQDEVKTLQGRVFAAELSASQQMAEEAVVLALIDPANRPSRPEGKSPKLFIVIGAMVFAMMGAGLALALALVDDRLYTVGDLENLGLARVQVLIPKDKKRRRRKLFGRGRNGPAK